MIEYRYTPLPGAISVSIWRRVSHWKLSNHIPRCSPSPNIVPLLCLVISISAYRSSRISSGDVPGSYSMNPLIVTLRVRCFDFVRGISIMSERDRMSSGMSAPFRAIMHVVYMLLTLLVPLSKSCLSMVLPR